MGKSNWRLKFLSKSLISRVISESTGTLLIEKYSMITSRSSTIPKSLVGNTLFIHKGSQYREIKLSDYHVGFKFGEFALTRKLNIFRKKNKPNRR